MLRNAVKHIPSTPGIYIFFRDKTPIYVGKATNLKARLLSHFAAAKLDNFEKSITQEADHIDYQQTESDFGALIIEANLIRRYKPKYNRRGRDDKSFLYIKVTIHETYPKIFPVRATQLNNYDKFFGPFPNQKIVIQLIRILRKISPFCTQKKISAAACFYSKIGQCSPCPNTIEKIKNKKEKTYWQKIYRSNIKKIISLLEGKIEPVTNNLYKELKQLIKNQQYEEALTLRNRIYLLERLSTAYIFRNEDSQEINDTTKPLLTLLKPFFPNLKNLDRIEGIDISNLFLSEAVGSLVTFSQGLPDKSAYRRFKIRFPKSRSDFDRISELLTRRFKTSWPKPNLLIIDGGKPQVNTALNTLKKLNIKLPIIGIAKAPDRLIIGDKNLSQIRPPLTDRGFNLVRSVRDESHRFAKKYHLYLRSKSIGLG